MLKLMKYEWISRWKFFLSGFIVCILLNVELISKLINETKGLILLAILVLILFGMGIVLVVDHAMRMYKSLFTEEAQLLFITPINGYKILGGKIANIFLECVGLGLIVGITGFINYKVAVNKVPELEMLSKISQDSVLNIMKILILMLLGYMMFMLMIYLSMTLAKSIFSAIKYGKILSFVFFIVISKIVYMITDWLGSFNDAPNLVGEVMDFVIPNTTFIWDVGIIVILFILTGYLLDRKINL